MRLCYKEWGTGDEAIILLHDAGEASSVWTPFAERLALPGYKIYAIDLRGARSLVIEQKAQHTPDDETMRAGHGNSTWSSDHAYWPDVMGNDVESFVLEKDLYVRPLVLWELASARPQPWPLRCAAPGSWGRSSWPSTRPSPRRRSCASTRCRPRCFPVSAQNLAIYCCCPGLRVAVRGDGGTLMTKTRRVP